MSDLDAIIIGAGHNGLTCAAYLGMAGLRVRVVGAARRRRRRLRDRGIPSRLPQLDRGLHGQPAAAQDHPRSETARARTAHRRTPRAEFSAAAGWPLSAHRRRPHRSARSPNSAPRMPAAIPPIRPRSAASPTCCAASCSRRRPISLSAISPTRCAELGKLAAIGKRLWQDDSLTAAFDLLRQSAGDMLDGWFDSDPIKAVLGFDAVVGNLASPYTPGSAYVLLHHVFGEVNGKRGRVGPRHRRHGRDHAGHGDGCRRARRAHRRRLRGARSHRRARPRRRRRAGGRHGGPRPRRHRQCRSANAVSGAGAARSGAARRRPHA